MEDPRPGMILILLVLSVILRINGGILIWTKRDRIPLLPSILLDIFSPVLCLVTVSFVTGKGYSGERTSSVRGTIVMMVSLLISQFITGMIFVGAYFIMGMDIPSGRAIGPGSDGSTFLPIHILVLVSYYSLLLFLMLRILWKDRSLPSFFKGDRVLSTTIFGLIALIPLSLASNLIVYAFERLDLPGESSIVSGVGGAIDIVYLGVAIALVAPFIEELLFRGYVYDQIREKSSKWTAILVTGVLFSLAHLSLASFIPIFILGVFMGLLRERTGSIFPSMVFHSANNLLALVFIVIS